MRLAFDASRLKRATASGSCTIEAFITLMALRRPIFTCSARYTWPMPPRPVSSLCDSGRPALGPRDRASAPTSAASAHRSGRIARHRGTRSYRRGRSSRRNLDLQQLVAHQDPRLIAQHHVAARRERDPVAAVGVHHHEVRVFGAHQGMARAHRRIVGEYPFTLLAADGDVAAGGELDHVTYAA